jgi:hypothetical protein
MKILGLFTFAPQLCRNDNMRTYALFLTQEREKLLYLTASESYHNTFIYLIRLTLSIPWYHNT